MVGASSIAVLLFQLSVSLLWSPHGTPLTGMLFLPVSLPLCPQTQHVVGTQEAHPWWRAVFALTEEEEIKGRAGIVGIVWREAKAWREGRDT